MPDIISSTENDTTFAKRYLRASVLLMDALAEPSKFNFDHAMTSAVLAIGASTGSDIEWGLGQDIAKSVAKAAFQHGYRL